MHNNCEWASAIKNTLGNKASGFTSHLADHFYIINKLGDINPQVTLVSPKGGQPPIDPKSEDPSSQTDATQNG
ncbi:hypothetical protein J3D55_002349 [Chryseobacterium ginsenosidimutans]|nr:hypothetical protein [Chryseobacterium ginsenosidimutans]